MTQPLRILVVDDNRSAADALARVLRKAGDDVTPMYDGHSAIDEINSSPPDLVLTDLKMAPVDGLAVLQAARDQRPAVECIVFTAFGDVDIAVKAMRMGARDFLTKPVTVEQIAARLDKLRQPLEVFTDHGGFIAESSTSRRLLDALQRAAAVPSRVWIEGELGSGRVYCAHTIHQLARDGSAPFTILDPARDMSWPESGTVVLPNVDDMPEDVQRSLGRRLQTVPDGLRVVSTASPDGRSLVTKGLLRPELYYTLAVVVLSVPALRHRTEDIRPLFKRALSRFSARYRRELPKPDPSTLSQLEHHAWPGNVRELMNVAERMVVMGTTEANVMVIDRGRTGLPRLEPGFSLSDYLEGTERRILEEALRLSAGDRAEAGRLLGVERNTLRYKLNKYGLLEK